MLLILALIIQCNLFAQATTDVSSLYQYGSPVLSCEDNLKNFIRNFHRYVDNAGEFHLMTYEYAGVVKNQRQARRLVSMNFGTQPFDAVCSYGDDFSTVRLSPSKNDSVDKKELQKKTTACADEFVKTGYHIYVIKFVFELKPYVFYVFISPETKQVVDGVSPLGFDIPERHFVFCDRRRFHM
jgi:hypothetical protein